MPRRRTSARGHLTSPKPSKTCGVMGFVGTKHVLAVMVACFAAHVWIQGSSAIDSVDPDISRNVSQIIADKGYPVEEYEVETRDGFVLSMQRLPRGVKPAPKKPAGAKKVVFLLHYLLGSSADWVINYPEQSLPYLLADAGYDVWLGNVRGNTYSRHLRYKRYQKEFWDFCFDEMISYDLPAMLDFVLNATGQQKLFYVGHSQGCLVLFGLLAERPEYNDKIELFAAMAPVTTVTYMRSPHTAPGAICGECRGPVCPVRRVRLPAKQSADEARRRNSVPVRGVAQPVRERHLLYLRTRGPTTQQDSTSRSREPHSGWNIGEKYGTLRSGEEYGTLCSGGEYGTLRSGDDMAHYAQKFDFGRTRNRALYGQAEPPEYNLTRVTAPVALYWSVGDWLADPKDVSQLRDKLPRLVLDFRVRDRSFTHLDFSVGVGARHLVYEPLMKAMASVRALVNHFYPDS
ncbi:hypothetical protein MRX96_039652 [Rhipicephalus microplus]